MECPRCHGVRSWVVRREKRKCCECKYEWRRGKLPFRLTRAEWKDILRYFMLGLSSNKIASETGLEKKRILRALNSVREVMIKDIPDVFDGDVEVDETYIGGQWKNRRKAARKAGTKRGRGASKQPVFGILCRGGKVWAEVVEDVEASTLMPLIRKRVKKGSTVYSDTWKSYTGVAARGYVHRLVDHGKKEYSDGHGNHINGLEGFWGYLKRQLAAKGGVRRDRLPLFLGEYVWRFNHRKIATNQKVAMLLKLIGNN